MNANVAAKGDDVSINSAVDIEVPVRDGDRAIHSRVRLDRAVTEGEALGVGQILLARGALLRDLARQLSRIPRAVSRGTLRSLILSLRQRRGAPERQGGKNE
jgi:hypothetical protein